MKHYMKTYDNRSGFLWEFMFFCLRLGLYFLKLMYGAFSGAWE